MGIRRHKWRTKRHWVQDRDRLRKKSDREQDKTKDKKNPKNKKKRKRTENWMIRRRAEKSGRRGPESGSRTER